ncbi:hypothetical protein DES40_0830 [Litorimonas taeanensis]|uniref:DoxX-like protein n=1 Tax=Litorimonas taeanensis TaxID=568099 RepID=A0A420WKG7_9PROT|nr:hypothetical protein [Litorimonas taeanensis]RKQ71507.1 hypothetical protein DES40_0830 [Litorimonas taeanensis]
MPKSLKPALLLTRLSIFAFLLPWQLMRFTSPDSAKGIAKKYYSVSDMPEWLGLAIGVFWMTLLISFVLGLKKSVSYALVFILHAGAILVTIKHYIPGQESYNQLFLAAIPAAAAMGLLYVLRREDTLLSLGGKWG